jgi:hypothetical protein
MATDKKTPAAKPQLTIAPDAGQLPTLEFSAAELSICYRAIMDMPLKRTDPAFAVADGVLRKIGMFAQAQAAAQSGQNAGNQG